MILLEPVQGAIWNCLNHYNYTDAVFLSERLYAEVKTDDTLFLLATAYYRNGQKDHAYHVLKERIDGSTECRYLLGMCAYDLEKYAEAEAAVLHKNSASSEITTFDDVTTEYGEQASYVLSLLGNIAAKTERKSRAIDAWTKALKLNPFQWSSFENLCKIGDSPDPQEVFQIPSATIQSISSLPKSNNNANDGVTSATSYEGNEDNFVTPPPQVLVNFNPASNTSSILCTPEDRSLCSNSAWFSGCIPLSTRMRTVFIQADTLNMGNSQSNFGYIFDTPSDNYQATPNSVTQSKLTVSNNHQSLAKRMKAQVDNFINRKEPMLQSCKPLFSQSTNVTKTPTMGLSVQACPNVRRSSRLFSNNYSVKENNKSPNRNKFATPKSPSRKSKQRITKCNLNKTVSLSEFNNKNKKEKTETVTSANNTKEESAITTNNNVENYIQQMLQIQKQSTESFMNIIKILGQAYLHLSKFNCKGAIEELNNLSYNQFETSWVYCLAGLAYFELADYESSIKYFSKVHNLEPYRIQFMDIYSTALWHLQNEVALSALAQDLISLNKNSAITWCVSGNCFSLRKEHDTAIKFFQRAVQVQANFPYAYTLLGHEYITTEELDKAMSCFRNAIKLDPRHYNAWFGLGTIYSKQERYNLAEINYARALEINPKSPVILCHIGIVQHALKQTEKALKTFNLAIANDPKSPLCKFHRGSIYFSLGRHAEALKELEELREIVPKESLVYYLIGKVHKKLGNTDLALMYFSWATDLDPKGASSHIKEAFDPSIGRSSNVVGGSPATPDLHQPEGGGGGSDSFRLQPHTLNFGTLPDNSEDSF